MKIKNIYTGLSLLLLASCSAESPFEGVGDGVGRVLTTDLEVEVRSNETLVRAENNIPSASDFTVSFVEVSSDPDTVATYPYGKMPEVVVLPLGEYYIEASYGGVYSDGKSAEFDKPHYAGRTENFIVEDNKIVDSFNKIICTLANVKVSVSFSDELKNVMSEDAKVTVKVGNDALEFDKNTSGDGFFKYLEGSTTLAATFTGQVEGEATNELKTYSNVKAGNYYKINFKLHSIEGGDPVGPDVPDTPDGDGTGDIVAGDGETESGPSIKVDAEVTIVDNNVNTDSGLKDGDEIIEDVMTPGGVDGNENPGTGDEPGPDEPTTVPPTIIAGDGIKMNVPNVNPSTCSFTVKSQTGLTGFVVVIESDLLDEKELEGVNLQKELNLVTASGDLKTNLEELGFPTGNNVVGAKEINVDITQFLGLLAVLGNGTHTFVINVSDAGGTTTDNLIIVCDN